MNAAGRDYDFICLGAGIGGLTAALTAHDLGLSVLVLEKSDQLGGVAAYSSGQTFAPASHFAEDAGIEDSWEAAAEYLDWMSDGTANPELLERLCRTAREAFAFTEQAGVRWCPLDLPDNYWPEAPGSLERGRMLEVEPFDGKELPEELRHIVRASPTNLFSNKEIFFEMGGIPRRASWDHDLAAQREAADIRFQGSALAAYLVLAAYERGIPMLTEVEVQEVLVEGGRVTGVVAQVAGDERRFTAANGVLVAMGGYDWNAELTLRYDQRENVGSRAPRSVTGDHFSLLEPLRPDVLVFHRGQGLGFLEPAEVAGDTRERWMPFYGGWPHAIVVNRRGLRFGDEARTSARRDGQRPSSDAALDLDENGEHVNFPCWGIFDSQYRSTYPIGRALPGSPLPDTFVSAPTIAELAERVGIDPGGLQETIERFNGYSRAGSDPEFGRGQNRWCHYQFGDPVTQPNPNLGTIEEPPYYAVPLALVAASLTQAGLRTDSDGQVVDVDGEPIRGLYAAGNSMAWQDLGSHYHSGTANLRGLVWGYIAARHAAGAVDAAAAVGAEQGERSER